MHPIHSHLTCALKRDQLRQNEQGTTHDHGLETVKEKKRNDFIPVARVLHCGRLLKSPRMAEADTARSLHPGWRGKNRSTFEPQ